MAAQYPPLKKDLPRIFNSGHFQSWEEAMQHLAMGNALISKCEKCKMEVGAQRQECDKLCEFYQALNAEWRGPQAPYPEAKMT